MYSVIRFFQSNKLTFEQQPDFVINEAGELESSFIELVLPNKMNVLKDVFIISTLV